MGDEVLTNDKFGASMALIVYEALDREQLDSYTARPGFDHSERCFVTKHPIEKGELLEGGPLSRKSLMDLCALLLPGVQKNVTYLPNEVIAHSALKGVVAWWRPAERRRLIFSKNAGIESGEFPIPPLLFVVANNALSVWVLGRNRRPLETDTVYHPPFFNCGRGRVCLGNTKKPGGANIEDIPKWERAFFVSRFTNHEDPLLKKTTGEKLWKSLAGSKKPFPLACLRKRGKVKDVLYFGGSNE